MKPLSAGAHQLGPGKFDAELNLDGKAFCPDGKPATTLNPRAFGLAGVHLAELGEFGMLTSQFEEKRKKELSVLAQSPEQASCCLTAFRSNELSQARR
jgi:hypothetical protein